MSDVHSMIGALRQALERHEPRRVPASQRKIEAAVAVVIRQRAAGLDALLIHRAHRPSDPWSGQMAFPGGRVEPTDRDSLRAAIRECREEIGLDLDRDAVGIGTLSDARPRGHRLRMGMVIEPYVFALRGDPDYALNEEVQEVVWVPIDFVSGRANRSRLLWWRGLIPLLVPCYRYRGYVIWGMTLRILNELADLRLSA